MVNYPCFVWAGCDLQTVSQPRDTRDTEPGYRSVSRRHNVALTSSQCHIGVMLSCNSIMLSSKWCIDVIHLNLDGKNIHIFKKNCQSKNILDHLSSGLGISPNLRRGDLRHMRDMRDMRHETWDIGWFKTAFHITVAIRISVKHHTILTTNPKYSGAFRKREFLRCDLHR